MYLLTIFMNCMDYINHLTLKGRKLVAFCLAGISIGGNLPGRKMNWRVFLARIWNGGILKWWENWRSYPGNMAKTYYFSKTLVCYEKINDYVISTQYISSLAIRAVILYNLFTMYLSICLCFTLFPIQKSDCVLSYLFLFI